MGHRQTLAVVTDLAQPAFWRTTGTQFPQSVYETAERQVNLTEQSLVDWDSARHPGNVTENRVATFDDVIHDWRETSLVCNIDIMDVILMLSIFATQLYSHVLNMCLHTKQATAFQSHRETDVTDSKRS